MGKTEVIAMLSSLVKSNSLTNDKILDWSKFKAFAEDKNSKHLQKTNMKEVLKIFFGREENVVGKEKPAFSPFPTMFSKSFLFGVIKSWDCVAKN